MVAVWTSLQALAHEPGSDDLGEVKVSRHDPVQDSYWTDPDRGIGSYLVRFRWRPEDDKVYCIDFEAHEVISDPPAFLVGDDVSDGLTEDPEKATPTVTGFVKWDGCTQIYFPGEPAIHAEGQGDLTALFDCLLKVRINALTRMGSLEYL